MKYYIFIIIIIYITLPTCNEKPKKLRSIPKNLSPYTEVLEQIKVSHQTLAVRYHQTGSLSVKRDIIKETRIALFYIIRDKLLPQWLGTPWNFYGTTTTPRKGAIACGYFVTTILRDAGFKVERARLARQASELIIKTLTKPFFS